MKNTMKQRNFINAIILFLLIPVIMFLLPTISLSLFPIKYNQTFCDSVLIIVALTLNHFVFKIKIKWFTFKKPLSQILQCIPAVIFLLMTKDISRLLSIFSFNLLIIVTTMLIAFAEEIVMRGLLLPVSLRLTNNRYFTSILISSLGFGLSHIVNLEHMHPKIFGLQIILVFSSGILLGTLYLTTKNIMLPIIFHFVNDVPVMVGSNSAPMVLSNSRLCIMYVILIGIAFVCCMVSLVQIHIYKKNCNLHVRH